MSAQNSTLRSARTIRPGLLQPQTEAPPPRPRTAPARAEAAAPRVASGVRPIGGRPDQKPTAPAMPALALPDPPLDLVCSASHGHEDEDPDGPTTMVRARVSASPRAIVRDRAILLRLDGALEERVIFLPNTSVTVGRGRGSSLRVDDDEVSRRHAEIRFEAGGHVLVDLDSRNGTAVQGRRAQRVELHDGDLVQFGPRVLFRYTLMDEQQERMLRKLDESSTRDALTGAFNRSYFTERGASEIAYALRHDADLALVLFDLDHFKQVNDTFGHPAGDAVLAFVAATASNRLRVEDVFARYGGEEFAVLLRGTDLAGAGRSGERLRGAIAGATILHEGNLIPVTISVGCATLRGCATKTLDALVAAADARLYAAKRAGRNRVVVA